MTNSPDNAQPAPRPVTTAEHDVLMAAARDGMTLVSKGRLVATPTAQAAPAAGAVAGPSVRKVFLVATGEEHEGEATYTRHDDAPPPLCDSECLYTAAPTPAAQADSVPKAQFDDPKVQAVYAILCDDTDWPPKENPQQHWEGWIARRIVDALLADSVLEDAALLHYALADGGNQSMNWQDVYDDWNGEGYFIDALRAAYKQDAARKQGVKHD